MKEFFVLAEVTASPYPAEIAAALLLPKASVTLYVRNLVAKGLIRREIDDADLRRHRLALTPAGEQARDRALAALAAEYDRRLARITPQDRTELQASFRKCSRPLRTRRRAVTPADRAKGRDPTPGVRRACRSGARTG
ncbi:MarR family transcriptional regulator [Streptomyces sp. AcH 505]|uniref:MarR family transcriptional regulator n=1 Tax=Streptomyces sp. AcH 505 TaxID=352211 RepID=UPI00099C3E55